MTSSKGIYNGYVPRVQPDKDTSRMHAANYAAGTALLSFCGYVFLWTLAKVLYPMLPNGSIALCLPVGLLVGASYGSMKLIAFTEEYRNYVYTLEQEQQQIDDMTREAVKSQNRQNSHVTGCLVRGVDNAYHRIPVELSKADLHAVKASMLSRGAFVVRGVNALLNDETRASALRIELHRLGILERPQARQATRLTPAGLKAVMRWN